MHLQKSALALVTDADVSNDVAEETRLDRVDPKLLGEFCEDLVSQNAAGSDLLKEIDALLNGRLPNPQRDALESAKGALTDGLVPAIQKLIDTLGKSCPPIKR